MTRSTRFGRRRITLVGTIAIGVVLLTAMPASAATYPRISGEGSSWAANAVQQWQADMQNQGVTVDFNPNGSSQGRKDFAQQIATDYAVSEIPYSGDTADVQDSFRPQFGYSLMPMVAGGTSFMYNLRVNGGRLTALKLSQAAIAGIFSGQITQWNDPAIRADNAGVNLPAAPITVVVRSEGSGATAQFTLWMLRQFPDAYKRLCQTSGACDGAHATSYFPAARLPNFVAQSGSNGVTTYTTNTPYTINYDEYSYAQQVGFPVAQVKNAAGYYTVPTDSAVAVALIKAKINTNAKDPNYLSQDLSEVYPYTDPRTYPISSYSYFITPRQTTGSFTPAKGATLGYFTQYALCEGQRTMGKLGYSPLPMNLVLAAMEQVKLIPGIDKPTLDKIAATEKGVSQGNANPCNNPTFKPGDDPSHNVLVDTAPFPAGCDAACQAPWKKPGVAQNPNGPKFQGAGIAAQNNAAPEPSVSAAAPQACDPDTGICSDSASAQGVAKVTPVSAVIPGQLGWAGPQTLMVIVGLLVAMLLLAPPLASRLLFGVARRARGQK